MNYFDLLPDEKILEICQSMDNRTLNTFIRSNSRISQVCQEILNQRKDTYLEQQEIINQINNKIYKDYLCY